MRVFIWRMSSLTLFCLRVPSGTNTNAYQGVCLPLVGHHKMSRNVTHGHTPKFEVPLEVSHGLVLGLPIVVSFPAVLGTSGRGSSGF